MQVSSICDLSKLIKIWIDIANSVPFLACLKARCKYNAAAIRWGQNHVNMIEMPETKKLSQHIVYSAMQFWSFWMF